MEHGPGKGGARRIRPRVRLPVDPVALAVEGVGRERDLAARVALVEAAPIDLDSRAVEAGGGVQQGYPVVGAPAKRREPAGPAPETITS